MAQTDTFFKQRDKRRWVTDRLASSVIKLGGISVLVALVLLIIYLILMIAPIFSAASITKLEHYSFANPSLISSDSTRTTIQPFTDQAVATGIDERGETAFIFSQKGELSFQAINRSNKSQHRSDLLKTQIVANPSAFKAAMVSSGWYAYANEQGQVKAVHPKFSSIYSNNGRQASPSVISFSKQPVQLDLNGGEIADFDFSITGNKAIFIGRNPNGDWHGIAYSKPHQFNQINETTHAATSDKQQNWQQTRLTLPNLKVHVVDYRVTPDTQTLYVLSRDAISVLKRQSNQFVLRETVPLSAIADVEKTDSEKLNVEKRIEEEKISTQPNQVNGVSLQLLSGANSLLVTDENGQVSQWFDVLKNGKRQLTHIRDFQLSPNAEVILPDYYRKGFYSFHQNGLIENFYTTSKNEVFSKQFNNTGDVLAAGVSSNEKYLIAASHKGLDLYVVDNPYPEISFSALWDKVWYEGYPEPAYIWQSTAASNDFEPKFSFVPIAFGTLKAAIFAMIFAVPISIFGAIYTGYFMTDKMRRYVKPTIELMEALPTVIIGFLAGLWLAPIVEMNLLSTLLFLLSLPVVILIAAFAWKLIRQRFKLKEQQGWAALMLIPVVIGFAILVASFGHNIEHWLFGGDVRLFLANIGIDFDQRNALIVGFAMGFAVIPTIFTIAEDAIFSVPQHLSDGARALGATSWQCLTTVVLVTASPGIFSAVMMGLGRAVGETMIVLMATGNTPVMDWNILEGMRTLSANIAIEMPESEVGSSHFRLLFLSAFLLFVFTFVVNSIAEVIRQRLKEKYSAL